MLRQRGVPADAVTGAGDQCQRDISKAGEQRHRKPCAQQVPQPRDGMRQASSASTLMPSTTGAAGEWNQPRVRRRRRSVAAAGHHQQTANVASVIAAPVGDQQFGMRPARQDASAAPRHRRRQQQQRQQHEERIAAVPERPDPHRALRAGTEQARLRKHARKMSTCTAAMIATNTEALASAARYAMRDERKCV